MKQHLLWQQRNIVFSLLCRSGLVLLAVEAHYTEPHPHQVLHACFVQLWTKLEQAKLFLLEIKKKIQRPVFKYLLHEVSCLQQIMTFALFFLLIYFLFTFVILLQATAEANNLAAAACSRNHYMQSMEAVSFCLLF